MISGATTGMLKRKDILFVLVRVRLIFMPPGAKACMLVFLVDAGHDLTGVSGRYEGLETGVEDVPVYTSCNSAEQRQQLLPVAPVAVGPVGEEQRGQRSVSGGVCSTASRHLCSPPGQTPRL